MPLYQENVLLISPQGLISDEARAVWPRNVAERVALAGQGCDLDRV